MAQRRLHKRVLKRILIRCRHETLSFDGVTLDICPGGVFVITDNLLPAATMLDIELWIDEDEPLHCVGEVTWVNRGQVIHYPPGFGLQFIEPSESTMECLWRFCSDQDEDQDGWTLQW